MSPTRPIDDEISALLADPAKRIVGDLRWTDDEDLGGHEFLVPVASALSDLLLVRGQRCPAAGTLRFALILRGLGRLCALDLGHHGAHLHRWTPGRRDALATLPPDAAASDERSAWALFCQQTHITHDGTLTEPPATQETLL